MKSGWEIKTIGEVCEIYNGGTPSTSIPEYWDGGIQWITPKDMGKSKEMYVSCCERTISQEGVEHSSTKVLPKRSVIVSSRAPIGYVAINDVPMATNQGCKGFVLGKELYPEFLYYFLLASTELLNKLGTGATFKEVSGKKLAGIEIPVPSITEQQRIVDILDREFAKIDALKANAEKSLKAAKDLFQTTLKKELEPKEGWFSKELSSICRVINGRAYSKEEFFDTGKYRVLRVGNFFTNDRWYYSNLELEEDKYCYQGDLLYAWSASFGPRIWMGEKVIYHYHIWKLVNQEETIRKMFLYYWLMSPFFMAQTMNDLHGTTMVHITKGIMERTMVSFPNVSVQDGIVGEIEQASHLCQALQQNYQKTLTLCDDLKQSLLRKAFNGEL